jgi:hypothetical protein
MYAHLDDSPMIGPVESGHDDGNLGVKRYETMARWFDSPKNDRLGTTAVS